MIGFRTKNIDWHKFKTSRIHLLYNLHIIITILFFFGQFVITFLVIAHCGFQFFPALAHQLIIKRLRTDTEKGRVISKRIKYFEIRDTKCHHDIGNSMRFREHVFDSFTGFDIPVLDTGFTHRLFHIFRKTFSFTDTFHDLKGKSIFNSGMYQIGHNIITGTNGGRKCTISFFNEILGIVQPNVCTM